MWNLSQVENYKELNYQLLLEMETLLYVYSDKHCQNYYFWARRIALSLPKERRPLLISLKSIVRIKTNPFINKIKITASAASFNCVLIKIDVNGGAKQNAKREKKLIKDKL